MMVSDDSVYFLEIRDTLVLVRISLLHFLMSFRFFVLQCFVTANLICGSLHLFVRFTSSIRSATLSFVVCIFCRFPFSRVIFLVATCQYLPLQLSYLPLDTLCKGISAETIVRSCVQTVLFRSNST